MRFFRIGTAYDDFRSRVAVHREMQLVLYGGEEAAGYKRVDVIVRGRRKQIGDLLILPAFACANLADLFEQAAETVLVEYLAVLEAFRVQYVTLDHEVAQDLGGPLPEGCSPLAVDAVSDGNNGVEIVVLCLLNLAIRGSYSEIPNN